MIRTQRIEVTKEQLVTTVSIPTLGKRGTKEILILMLNSRVLHKKMLYKEIRRKGEQSEQYETILPGDPLEILMEGKSYIEFYKENYKNMAFRFKVDEDMILIWEENEDNCGIRIVGCCVISVNSFFQLLEWLLVAILNRLDSWVYESVTGW